MRDFIPYMEIPLRVVLVTPVLLLAFVGIIVWVYRRSARKRYERFGELPLEDGLKINPDGSSRPGSGTKTGNASGTATTAAPPLRTGNGEE